MSDPAIEEREAIVRWLREKEARANAEAVRDKIIRKVMAVMGFSLGMAADRIERAAHHPGKDDHR